MDPIIRVDKIRIIYNQGKSNEVRALEETSLEIYPHEYVIIYGPSGCGKSTLLYTVSGLQTPTYGNVFIRGKSLLKMTATEKLSFHQKTVGMIFQAFYLISSLNVIDNVCLPRVFLGDRPLTRRIDGIRLIRRFGIIEQAEKFPHQLSGGQKQRSAIARALINNPEIILADEPVGNLDSENANNVLKILQSLHQTEGKTIVLVTHNPEHLIYADRVIHMKDGRVIREEVRNDKRSLEEQEKESRWVEETKGNSEFRFLMSSFKNLAPQQVDVLLVPFKAKQLMSHLLSEMNEEQVSSGEAFLKEVLFNNLSAENFGQRLEQHLDAGGAGWNKVRAKNFALRVGSIMEQVYFLHTEPPTTEPLSRYLAETFHLRINDVQMLRMQTVLGQRVRSEIGQAELFKKLDAPFGGGGVGLHRMTVGRIVREVEMLMLLKYS